MVTVVSFNLSAVRLSHEEPNAGTANKETNIHNVHLMVEIFIGSLRVGESIYRYAHVANRLNLINFGTTLPLGSFT
jgi:hypothetical protein